MEGGQPEPRDWVWALRAHQWPLAPEEAALSGVPGHVYYHTAGESNHVSSDPCKVPRCTHPCTPSWRASPSWISATPPPGCPPDSGELLGQEEGDHLSWLCGSDVFLCGFATSECYLIAAMAYDSYVAVCNPCSTQLPCLLRSVPLWLWDPMVQDFLILWSTQAVSLVWNSVVLTWSSLLLWWTTHPVSVLCGHLTVWNLALRFAGFNLLSCTLTILVSYLLIHHHPEDELSPGQIQGLFHLCFPLHCCVPLLRHNTFHVPAPQVQLLPNPRPHSCCDLHSGDPTAQPPYLLFEKQGCEEEALRKVWERKIMEGSS